MKFGLRIPSIKKRIAARTSWKRVTRHSLGLKAPRGWGWLTNPKKAAYNRAYNRTTFGIGDVLKSGAGSRTAQSSGSGCGAMLAVAVVVVGCLAGAAPFFIVVGIGTACVVLGLKIHKSRRLAREQARLELESREQAAAAEQRARELAAAEEEQRRQRYASLEHRFGIDIAQAIWKHQYWQGATSDMIVESLGAPAEIKERVYKTKTKMTYCYHRTGVNRYALKIHIENDAVVGWDEK